MNSTIFTLNTATNVHSIDYNDKTGEYTVYTNNVLRRSFDTYGEALQFIFEKQGDIDFYTKQRVDVLVHLSLTKS